MSLYHVVVLLPLILCTSCGEIARVRADEMQKESQEIAAWATKTHADIIGILPILPPTRLSRDESVEVEGLINKYPNTFSLAKLAFTKKSDELWHDVILNGRNAVPTSFTTFSVSDQASLSATVRSGKLPKAWIIMIEKSNNYFGDTDRFLALISSDGIPLAYGYFGVNAGSVNNMCRAGVYVPSDKAFADQNPVKKLDDLPVPK